MTKQERLEMINTKGHVDFVYIAGLNGKKIGIYATSLAAAKQKAVEHFHAKKKDLGLIWVEKAEED